VQEVADEVPEAHRVALDHPDLLGHVGRQVGAVGEQLEVIEDGGERRAQLVGYDATSSSLTPSARMKSVTSA
jgi:hypothetical protein